MNTKFGLERIKSKRITFGQKAADFITKIVGSWYFIIFLIIYVITWVTLNTYGILFGVWDEYPFIVLNLTLSCFAALHASIILMSDKRRLDLDSHRMEYDYIIDRKTERELKKVQLDIIEIKEVLLKKSMRGESAQLKKDLNNIQKELEEIESKLK